MQLRSNSKESDTVHTASANDTIDDLSDSNEIDVDLTNTYDTTSDIIDNSSDTINDIYATADITGFQTGSPSAIKDLCTFLENRILAIDPLTTMALGKLEYHTHFHPHYTPPDKDGGFGKTLYKRPPPSDEELGLVFLGEICSSVYGTAITAKGNHYAGTANYPKARSIHVQHFLTELELLTFHLSQSPTTQS